MIIKKIKISDLFFIKKIIKKKQIASRFVKIIKKKRKKSLKNQNFGLSKIRNTLYSCFAAGSPPQAENFVVLRFINAVFLRKLSNFEGFL